MMRLTKTRIGMLLIVLLCAAGVVWHYATTRDAATGPAGRKGPAGAPRAAGAPITVSHDTTYITGPLKADGTVDYIAYLNARSSKGVTPDNNAAVLLMRAFGPGTSRGKAARARMLKLIGMPPLPAGGSYIVLFNDYVEGLPETDRPGAENDRTPGDTAGEQLYKAMERPWSARDYPLIADWLKANAVPLALVESASRRSHIYLPLVSNTDPAQLATAAHGLSQAWCAGRALAARAMLRVARGQTPQAWADLMAARRLARLISQGPTLMERLVAGAIEGLACDACKALITGGRLSGAQGRQCLVDLAALRPMPDIREAIANERFMGLDAIVTMARGPGAIEVHGTQQDDLLEIGRDLAGVKELDWDEVLRFWNAWNDRRDKALASNNPRRRALTWGRFEDKLRKMHNQLSNDARAGNGIQSIPAMLKKPDADRKRLSRTAAAAIVTTLIGTELPGVEYQLRRAVHADLLRVSLAIGLHRAETGRFPATLADLAPKYFKELPEDGFSRKALVYTRQGKGCIVYSVGLNLTDDGGIDNSDEEDVDPDDEKDDVAVRFKR